QLQSSLPPGVTAAHVAKATLKLFVSPGANPSGTFNIYAVTGPWSESTLSLSGQPALAATAFASGISAGRTESFVVVDVTQLVQEWLTGGSNGGLDNNGIALVAATNSSYVVFDSK